MQFVVGCENNVLCKLAQPYYTKKGYFGHFSRCHFS